MTSGMLKMRAVLVLKLLTCSWAASGSYDGAGADFDGEDTGPYMDGKQS